MERQLNQKSAILVANTPTTISWTAPDFNRAFSESIIKKQVSIRFSCTSSCANSVNVGVRYSTLTKTYQISERQTLFVIPPNNSVEITPSSKPALGLLYDWITSISIDLLSASGGVVTVVCTVDDEPPPLSADPGELLGLDNKQNQDYVLINNPQNAAINAGTTVTLFTYTVPAGKRFILDLLTVHLPPTPSYPELLECRAYLPNPSLSMFFTSKTDEGYTFNMMENTGYIFAAGDVLQVDIVNFDTTNYFVRSFLLGREIY